MIRRREFITLIGGAAATWPLAARGQQGERMRRIGVLLASVPHDLEQQTRIGAFLQGLQQANWTIGRNVRVDTRWAGAVAEEVRRQAADLVASEPEVILAQGVATLAPLLQATRSLPIVFVWVADPVGAGYVDGLSRPGGNVTGFMQYEYSLSGKWLELLKQIAPQVTRVAVLRDPASPTGGAQFGAIQSAAVPLGVEVSPVSVRDAAAIKHGVTAFARFANGGLIITGSALAAFHRDVIIRLAAEHKLPAVYYRRGYVTDGGLISYGPEIIDQFRGAAAYVDRILKGEKPAEMPVQAPSKYELIVNLKTAKALGITMPPQLLARADEVIE